MQKNKIKNLFVEENFIYFSETTETLIHMDTGPSEVISINIGLISLGPVSMLIIHRTMLFILTGGKHMYLC